MPCRRSISRRPACAASGTWPAPAAIRQLRHTPLRQALGISTPLRSKASSTVSPASAVKRSPLYPSVAIDARSAVEHVVADALGHRGHLLDQLRRDAEIGQRVAEVLDHQID